MKKPKKPKREEATGPELQLQKQSQETWRFYQDNYKPFEDVQIQRLEQLRSQSEMAEAGDVAVSQAREGRTPTAAALAESTRPGTAGFTQGALALEQGHGDLTANAMMLSEQQQMARADAARSRMIDWGTGRNNESAAITGRAASLAASREARHVGAQNSANRFHTNEMNDFLGTAAGAAFGLATSDAAFDKYQDWGNARQAKRFDKNQMMNGQPSPYPWMIS